MEKCNFSGHKKEGYEWVGYLSTKLKPARWPACFMDQI